MSIQTIITRGFGTFGSLEEIALRGYLTDSTTVSASVDSFRGTQTVEIVAAPTAPLTELNFLGHFADRNQIVLDDRHVRAQKGEDIASLSERTGNAWNSGRTAVLNATFIDARFERDELVKIARPSRYVPAAAAADLEGNGGDGDDGRT